MTINRLSGSPALFGGGSNLLGISVFTSTGTWTRPPGCVKVLVIATGGGAGGGGSEQSTNQVGDGGGAGPTEISLLDEHDFSDATVSITIGAGGAGAAAGGLASGIAGGTSSFGSYVTASGGANAGQQQTATGSDINISGGGAASPSGDLGTLGRPGGTGGMSFWAGGGHGGRGEVNESGNAPLTGSYGAGGGGGSEGGTSEPGGAGHAGIVVVYEYS